MPLSTPITGPSIINSAAKKIQRGFRNKQTRKQTMAASQKFRSVKSKIDEKERSKRLEEVKKNTSISMTRKKRTEIAKKFIRRLKILVDNKQKENDCPICLDKMIVYDVSHEDKVSDEDKVSKLPCTHKLHTKCLIDIIRHGIYLCPLCKKNIPSDTVDPIVFKEVHKLRYKLKEIDAQIKIITEEAKLINDEITINNEQKKSLNEKASEINQEYMIDKIGNLKNEYDIAVQNYEDFKEKNPIYEERLVSPERKSFMQTHSKYLADHSKILAERKLKLAPIKEEFDKLEAKNKILINEYESKIGVIVKLEEQRESIDDTFQKLNKFFKFINIKIMAT
jgi:hypothetical protein